MSNWVRLWEDMPTDPKWRVIARRANRPIAEVMAVFIFMLTNAGANANERGVLDNWSDEDIAAALDVEPGNIEAIRQAMQGKTLEGDKLSGWQKRQPKREDGSAERAKEWRERKRTQENATERPEKNRIDTEKKDAAAVAAQPVLLEFPAAAPSATDEADLFKRGKALLGNSSGGLVKKLIEAKGGNVALARAAIETASTKGDPREYIGALLRSREREGEKELARLRGDAW